MPSKLKPLCLVVVACLMAACASSDPAPGGTQAPGATQPAPSGTGPGPTEPGPTGPPSGSSDRGSGTITIDGETWTIFAARCEVGADETGMDDTPFTLSGAAEGPRVGELAIRLNTYDDNWAGQLSGEGTGVGEIFVTEAGAGVTDPAVRYRSDSAMSTLELALGGADDARRPLITSWSIDGSARSFSFEGTFVNTLLGEAGDYPAEAFVDGRIEGTCGSR